MMMMTMLSGEEGGEEGQEVDGMSEGSVVVKTLGTLDE